MVSRRIILLIATLVWGGLAASAAAQDSNYWSQQYGTRSELVGGVVVGSHLDLSSTFYNPGALPLLKNGEFLLSAQAFEYTKLSITGNGPGEDLTTSSWDTAPTLFAAQVPPEFLTGTIAISFLTRQAFDFKLQQVASEVGDIVNELPGQERAVAELFIDQSMNEYWAGLTWARPLSDETGLGTTVYGVYRGQNYRAQLTGQAVNDSAMGGSSIVINEFNYSHARLLAKIGFAWSADPVTLGAAVTTPSLGVLGNGRAQVNRSVIGFDLDNDGSEDSYLVNSYQEDLSVDYKSSWAIAVGGSYNFGNELGKTAIHVAAEWFASIDRYIVMQMNPFPGDTLFLAGGTLTQTAADVLNFGVGIEHSFREHLTIYASFITDRSFAVPGTATDASITVWDLYHFSVGSAFTLASLDLTLGLVYGRGSDTVPIGEEFRNPIIPFPDSLDIETSRLKIIVGFAFTF